MIKIGLKLRFKDHYDNSVAKGILKYSKEKIDWQISGEGSWFNNDIKNFDALIARIENEKEKECYENLNIPVIDIAGATKSNKFTYVQNDDWKTGINCGKYLKNLGIQNYAIALVSNVSWAKERMLGFSKGINKKIDDISIFSKPLNWWENIYSKNNIYLEKWLNSLKRPTALFCCNDLCAMKICFTLKKLNINVPQEILILGVDNEELLCMLSKPTISSMALQLEEIGYYAAKTLDSILSNKETQNYFIPPLQIIERESTSIIKDKDPLVAKAVSVIKNDHNCILNVDDLVGQLFCSRRTIEIKFKKERRMTIHEFIIEERLKKAVLLLKTTKMPIKNIYRECGFGSLQRFHSIFLKKYKITPKKYREIHSKLFQFSD